MDDQKEHALGDSESPDVIMEEDFDLRQFLGTMTRKSKRPPPTTRRRIEEIGEARDLRATISNSWDD